MGEERKLECDRFHISCLIVCVSRHLTCTFRLYRSMLQCLKCFIILHGKYNIGRTLNKITGDADGRFFTLRTILLSDVGVRPTHRANLQGSPSTCSVTPNSDV